MQQDALPARVRAGAAFFADDPVHADLRVRAVLAEGLTAPQDPSTDRGDGRRLTSARAERTYPPGHRTR